MRLRRLLLPALVALIPTAFLLGTLVNTGFTQQAATNPLLVAVDYMKVDPLKDEEYGRLEREIWKPMHQERIRQGHLRSWTMYRVRFPAGTKREYDYVTVNTYNSMADADRSIDDIASKVHPNMPLADLFRRTVSARDMVRGELWYQIDQAK